MTTTLYAIRRHARRQHVRLAFLIVAAIVLTGRSDERAVQAQSPPCDIVCENEKTAGVTPQSTWDITGIGDAQIQGFAAELSVNRGEQVQFKIQSLTGYDIEIYRLGYYGGNGARKVAEILDLPGNVTQPSCDTDAASGLVDCGDWVVTASWTTDVNIPSGIFIAKLIRDGGGASHIPFIVRDDNYAADLLFQTSDTTWQAYNRWGGGSLYCGGPVSNAGTVYDNAECPGRATKVSYNRPFDTRGHDATSFLFNAEYPMVRWLEKNGYAVKYWTGIDTDRFGANEAIGLTSVKKPKIFLSVGHDEYWSGTQRSNVEAARAAGVNLAFFSGNEMFWQTRWEASIDGTSTSHKTLVGYKESLHNSEIDGTPSPWTGTWRDGRLVAANPENALTGTLWVVNSGSAAITVPEPMGKLRLWRGTSVATLPPGGSATLGVETLGYEWDEDRANSSRPAGLMRLSSTTVGGVERVLDDAGVVVGPGTATHNLTMYRHSSGAYVFGAGTVQWSWGLDGNHDRGNPTTHPPDIRMQQATVNLFADMGDVQPDTLDAALTSASPSTDSTPPDSLITLPATGSLQAMNSPVVIRGTSTDTGGQVAAIEVSTDAGATWNRATGTGTWLYRWIPTASGSHTILSRAIDDSGNFETASPSIQVSVTSPGQAPGGPVLIVTSAANPFTSYYTEILRAEGFNLFATADIGSVSAATLDSYDVVILGEMALSAAQVTMFSDWVTAGGNLIAMRPDKQLYGLLGLTDAAATLSNAYLAVSSQTVPVAGIVSQSIQFHGTADLATLNGAASVATLYTDPSTATANPAVTVRSVGIAGGQAVAFLYDLARSVVYTRQGNPAWAGQNRDSVDPIRSDDMFFGNYVFDPQPDWVNLNKVAIPQADEQQRVLANTILYVNQDRKLLPRFWYFPRDEKAVVVMTGDAHGSDQSVARLSELYDSSTPSCSVDDWDCLRGTSYIYPSTLGLFDGGPGAAPGTVAWYVANKFEVGLHPNTGCQNYTAASLDQTFATQLDALMLAYPSMPPPRTNRTHCIVWSDYTSQAEVELQHGIRLDTTYYYWPGEWLLDRPGFMTGSGMPMRFAKQTGEIIDVYQVATQMTDEVNSGQTYPFTINSLLDRAVGPEGYYGAFTANMHGDGGVGSNTKQAQIVEAAQLRDVPVVSAEQMLDWLDGRNNSSFGAIAWNPGALTLSFTVTRAPGANGLRGMVPSAGASAGTLQQITRNGSVIPFALGAIKGITYAFFDATTGSYEATYVPDTTAPVISGVSATPLTATSASVSWTTDEGATSRVDYGTSAATLNLNVSNSTLVAGHALTLETLLPNTTYHYRVTSVDFFGNPSTFPAPPAAPLTFATPPNLQSFLDTTSADFSAGTPGASTFVAQTTDGEVILTPTAGSEFFGSTLPAGWTSGVWDGTGSVTVSNGQLVLNNGWARTTGSYSAGRALEFVATFGADANQHSGFAQNFNCGEPWAIFSTQGTDNQLFARTAVAGCSGPFIDTPIAGNFIGSSHRYRIDWNATDVAYFIDGVEVVRHNLQIAPMMQMLAASDFDNGGANSFTLTIDWERMSPYPASGEFVSRVFDAGSAVSWYNVAWTQGAPAGTAIAVDVRVGSTPVPDGSWTGFVSIPGSGGLITGVPARQYLQYRATLTTTDTYFTPEVRSVTVNHMIGEANTAPTAVDDVVTINEDTPHTFPATGAGSLTANDTDTETPTQLTVIAVANATNGTAILNLDGSVTFTPTANASGAGSFTYTVSDGALTDDGSVAVTINAVNDAPVGVADPSPAPGSFYNATEDVALVVPVATGVLANDTDVDNAHETLTALIHSLPAHGTVTLNLDGSFTYTPATNYSGPDGFFYKANDGNALSEPTGVSILVQGVNDVPIANNDTYDLSRSGVPVVVSSLVLSGDTAEGTTTIQHGLTTGHAVRISGANQAEYNGTFTVTVTGPTTFTYDVTGTPASPATGSIRATADDSTRTIAAPGVLGNDTDVDGQPLSAVLGTTTANGTLTLNADGSFTYTPNALFVGPDTFTYTASDGIGTSAVATVTLNVHNEIATQTVGAGGGTVATGDGASASTADPLETSVTTPIAGIVSIVEGPISGINPAPGYSFLGQEVGITISTITNENPLTDPNNPLVLSFTVDASLVAVGQTVQTLQVFRNGIQLANCPAGPLTTGDMPCVSSRATLGDGDLQFTVKTLAPSQWDVGALVAGDTNASTLEDTVLNGDLKTLSGHPNPASLTFAEEIAPTHGAVVINANGTFAYTPASNYNGSDSFTYSAMDAFGGVGYGTVSITITPVNDAPSFTAGANQSVQKNSGAHTVVGWATAIGAGPADESSQTVSFNVSSNNPGLFAAGPAVASNGTLTFTTATGVAGVATVTVTALDDGGTANGGVDASAPQVFTITVVDPFPVALCQNVTVAATLVGTAPASINNGSNDPDGGAVTLAQVPPGPYLAGSNSVVLQVTDSASQVSTCSATVTVTPFAAGASFGFEEASGGTSVDSSGNTNNGTFNTTTGPQRVTTGRFGKAMQFDGVNDLISVADANSLDFTSAMTLMAWVKAGTTTGWRNIIMKQTGSDLAYGIYSNDTATGTGRPSGYAKSGGVTRSVRANESALANRWMHITVTFAAATNQLRIYIDGSLHRTLTTSGSMAASTGPLTIGGNNVWLDEFFSGVLDEVRVMNVALSEADIRTLMTTPVVPGSAPPATDNTGLVAAYAFDSGTATDATGLGHNGVLTGTTSAPGKFGDGISFNGTSDRVTVADANDLDFTTGMTLEAYVKPSTVTNWRTVMLKEGPDGLVYAMYASDEVQKAAGFARIAGNDRDVRDPQALPLNTWSHVVVTYDKTLGLMQLWVDGVKKNQRAVTGDITTSTGPLYFGGNAFWGEYFGGQIDNVRIYNRALNVVEIQTNLGTAVQ